MQTIEQVTARYNELKAIHGKLKEKQPKLIKKQEKQFNLFQQQMVKVSLYELELVLQMREIVANENDSSTIPE